jgi:dipeptidyl-peptidase-4
MIDERALQHSPADGAMAAAQKPYELLAYPEERHMPRDAKGLEYQERRVLEFLERALGR